ncbi:MAG: hypothetical protein FD189_1060 [Elusimicrobia bacterium]|nr:MAG: hypothetical protein FD189_1060 [Elusimicrobiota bacterium]
MNRPWCCPEPRCAPLFQLKDGGWQLLECKPGESFFCFGKLAEAVRFVYDGIEHVNDLSTCCFTPLKGIIRYQENREDWYALKTAYTRALQKLEDTERIPDGA